jgi:hypothetical protein
MNAMNAPQIGIVVPTLGTRPDYLNQALRSIRDAGNCHIIVVAPEPEMIKANYEPELIDQIIQDPKRGLAEAINTGMRSLPSSVLYANWLGDDDLLSPNSLTYASQVLANSTSTVCVYGGCSYIGPKGEILWINKSGKYARWLMRVGPQLIPQPGSLFTLKAFKKAGELDSNYRYAFDLDLLMKLTKLGRVAFIPMILSSFRWHDGSLSVGGRQGSVNEASNIRKENLPKILRVISPIWELLIRKMILSAGFFLSRRAHIPKG